MMRPDPQKSRPHMVPHWRVHRPDRLARFHDHRRGRSLVKLAVLLTICTAAGFYFFNTFGDSKDASAEADLTEVLVHTVERGEFVSFVTESGDLESASNVEVRCEVKSAGVGGATTILEIVEEGTLVEEGDLLVQFDDAALQLSLMQQEIVVATDQAARIQAQSDLNQAKQALIEYELGTYVAEKKRLEGVQFQAELTLRDAENSLDHTRRMVKKGYRTQLQLNADQKALELARNAVDLAQINLDVLIDFTCPKMLTEFKAEIEKQEAYLTAAKYTEQLTLQRRDELAEQVRNCRIMAPSIGQVIYANDYKRRDAVVIEEGAQMREGQVIIRLPDPQNMQVDVRINDSKINQLEIGDPAEIVLDVDPELEIRGELAEIAPFPYPRSWVGAPIEYGAVVRVLNPPPNLRPGMRAKVHIYVERQADVLQVPVQSVIGRGEGHFCLIKDTQEKWDVRQLAVGANNDSFVVVDTGLMVGDQIALNPDLIWDDVADDFAPAQPLKPAPAAPKSKSPTGKPKGGKKAGGKGVAALGP